MKNNRLFAYTALVLVALQVLLVFLSWMITSVNFELPMHSMLSNEGIRWFFGHFIDCITSPVLLWIILISMAWGCLVDSGLLKTVCNLGNWKQFPYRKKIGIYFVIGILLIFIAIMMALTYIPHALLLNATGHLFPSSFSQSIIPAIAFCAIVCGACFGIIAGFLHNIVDVYQSMTMGIVHNARLFPLYIIVMELLGSIKYVFIL